MVRIVKFIVAHTNQGTAQLKWIRVENSRYVGTIILENSCDENSMSQKDLLAILRSLHALTPLVCIMWR